MSGDVSSASRQSLLQACLQKLHEGRCLQDRADITTNTVKQCSNTKKPVPVDEHISKQDYIQAICNNPLNKARSLVHAIHASGLRRDVFQERKRVGNEHGWHKYPPGTKVRLVKLLREVQMHWDTLLFMLNHLRIL